MNIAVVDNQTKHLPALLSLLAGHKPTVFRPTRLRPILRGDFDLVILTGGSGKSVASHPDFYAEEIELVRDYWNPVIGICLGGELINHAFGGTLAHLPERREHPMEIVALPESTSLFGELPSFAAFEAHEWACPSLPGELVGLAASHDGYEIFRHASRPVFGFQFHPEVPLNRKATGLFLDLVKSQAYRVGSKP